MSRKGENIYKRKDGTWEGRYIKERNTRKTRYGYIYGKSYRDVKARLIQAKAEWESKQAAVSNKKREETLSNAADAWLESSKVLFKKSTLVKYGNLLRLYILPAMGDCFLSEITNDRIYEFGKELLKEGGSKGNGLSPKFRMQISIHSDIPLQPDVLRLDSMLKVSVKFLVMPR